MIVTEIFMIHLTERYMFNKNNRTTLKACRVDLCISNDDDDGYYENREN